MGFRTGASPERRAVEAQIDDEMLALITELTNEITWYMRERGLTRADLAARMGVSPGRVSQILGGTENLTLRTLAALSTALDARFDMELRTLKGGETYRSRDTAQAEAAPAENHHAHTRATHRQARLGRRALCGRNRYRSGRRDARAIAGVRSGRCSRTSRSASTSRGASSGTGGPAGRTVTATPGAYRGQMPGGIAAGADRTR
jgi:transcriptional regulator with XRE-family HTH domain